MDAATLNYHVEQQLERLRREFVGEISAAHVTAVGTACFDGLRAEARILDFIPVLGYRHAREELLRYGREELQPVA
jgi:hypothetical protein